MPDRVVGPQTPIRSPRPLSPSQGCAPLLRSHTIRIIHPHRRQDPGVTLSSHPTITRDAAHCDVAVAAETQAYRLGTQHPAQILRHSQHLIFICSDRIPLGADQLFPAPAQIAQGNLKKALLPYRHLAWGGWGLRAS